MLPCGMLVRVINAVCNVMGGGHVTNLPECHVELGACRLFLFVCERNP